MRRDFLSFLVAACVSLTMLAIYHFIHPGIEGAAYASIDGAAQPREEFEQRKARRTVSYNPDNLLNMTGQDVRGLLSEPGLVRRDAPTVVWQYRTESCVLDVYFSTTKNDPAFDPVVHYEVRARENGVSDETVKPVCVRELVRQRNAPRMADAGKFYKSR